MIPLLVTLTLASVLNGAVSAPAVSSVHVSFVSGNKATQYSHSHATGGSAAAPLVQYNLVSSPSASTGDTGDHVLRKRSITNRPDRGGRIEGSYEGVMTSFPATSTAPTTFKRKRSRHSISSKFHRETLQSTPTDSTLLLSTFDPTNPTNEAVTITEETTDFPTTAPTFMLRKMMRSRVRFVESPKTTSSSDMILPKASSRDGQTVTMSGGSLLSELSTTTADALKAKHKKPRDSKAVKRSPFIAENFDAGGVTFPDFDEFGGDEFGSLRNFAGTSNNNNGGGGRGSVGAHTHANPEALSPDGVFLPPLPTEASDYSDTDPYLADPDTAKYASQHPPFFAAFPHKRTVLALNEQRVHNGLEPNILRSIRPYFAFFEATHNPHSHSPDAADVDLPNDYPYPQPLQHHLPLTYTDSDVSNQFFDHLDPTHLLYAESAAQPKPVMPPTSWSIFEKRK